MPTLNLGTVEGKPFQVDAQLVATGRTCVIGTSGSGKSYTVGVISEELCKNKVPFVLVDIEGEYSGLKERYEVVWIGDDEKSDLKWTEHNLEELAVQALDTAPLILDLSEVDDPKGKVSAFLTGLYREISKRRTPYLVVLEEADRFAPQVGDRLQIFDEVARRGRKRGLGLMLCTQRPSLVDKNILSQCANQMIGKLVIQNDLKSVAQFFPGKGMPTQLTALSPGTFYALGGLSVAPACVSIRQRETRPGGVTPKLMDRVVKPSSEILAKLRGSNLQTSQIQRGLLGLAPSIMKGQVPALVKRQKSHFLFGEEESVSLVSLLYRPLFEIGIRVRTGVLKKKFETKFFVMDGMGNRLVEWNDGLVFRDAGLDRFLGLTSLHLELLRAIQPDRDSSMIEVAGKSRMPEVLIRKLMKLLEERRLVTSVKIGKTKMFRRLVDLPRILLRDYPMTLVQVDMPQFKPDQIKMNENDVREVVKGTFEGSDVDIFRQFFYPVYRVDLNLKQKRRAVFLDGRTGRKIEF